MLIFDVISKASFSVHISVQTGWVIYSSHSALRAQHGANGPGSISIIISALQTLDWHLQNGNLLNYSQFTLPTFAIYEIAQLSEGLLGYIVHEIGRVSHFNWKPLIKADIFYEKQLPLNSHFVSVLQQNLMWTVFVWLLHVWITSSWLRGLSLIFLNYVNWLGKTLLSEVT